MVTVSGFVIGFKRGFAFACWLYWIFCCKIRLLFVLKNADRKSYSIFEEILNRNYCKYVTDIVFVNIFSSLALIILLEVELRFIYEICGLIKFGN